MQDLLSADFLKSVIPALGAVVAWFENERRRRSADIHAGLVMPGLVRFR